MPDAETSQPMSRGKQGKLVCCDCGNQATVKVDQYGMPADNPRCRDCYELHCSRVFREAAHARM